MNHCATWLLSETLCSSALTPYLSTFKAGHCSTAMELSASKLAFPRQAFTNRKRHRRNDKLDAIDGIIRFLVLKCSVAENSH